ncbi:hypothetical protein NDU88_004860 [Pleurodeles waltl]|uniref:Secreted protein n=1 Tax=Pleurodeles waltl TaxID=8319 RepID=A0AAV7LQK9_PLEWA|nr:hypothetical protein NDU88_004860 [Pleurodeles waltl]
MAAVFAALFLSFRRACDLCAGAADESRALPGGASSKERRRSSAVLPALNEEFAGPSLVTMGLYSSSLTRQSQTNSRKQTLIRRG